VKGRVGQLNDCQLTAYLCQLNRSTGEPAGQPILIGTWRDKVEDPAQDWIMAFDMSRDGTRPARPTTIFDPGPTGYDARTAPAKERRQLLAGHLERTAERNRRSDRPIPSQLCGGQGLRPDGGTEPIQTLSRADSLKLTLSDHPFIVTLAQE
jgi:hypothetical protein